MLGHLGILRVLGVREFEEHAEGEEGGLDGLDRGPAGAQSVETDRALGGSQLVAVYTRVGERKGVAYRLTADVRMPDLGVELDDG